MNFRKFKEALKLFSITGGSLAHLEGIQKRANDLLQRMEKEKDPEANSFTKNYIYNIFLT